MAELRLQVMFVILAQAGIQSVAYVMLTNHSAAFLNPLAPEGRGPE